MREAMLLVLVVGMMLAGCTSEEATPEPPSQQGQQQAAPDTAGTTATASKTSPPTATDQGRDVEQRLEDAMLAARVKTALVENRQLRPFDFEPRVTGERVTLTGDVASRVHGQTAAEVARQVEGVEEVLNRLTVDGQQVAWNASEASPEDRQVAASQGGSSAPGPSDGSTSGNTYHTVKTGETLWAIASEHGTSVSRLKQLNNLRGDGLRPGERLLVKKGSGTGGGSSSGTASSGGPALADAGGQQASSQQQQKSAPSNASQSGSKGSSSEASQSKSNTEGGKETAEYYVVKSGESLWSIAQKNDITVARLKELNGLSSNNLMPGDRLRVE